jgi:ribosome maturation factor RimP
MISKEKIELLIADKLAEGDYFVVSLDVSASNKIKLVVDSMSGITIEECVGFSRAIEHNLDREVEDFELMVTSPGLTSPLIVKQQYKKNIDRELNIQLKNKTNIKGVLTSALDEQITVLEEKKVKVEGNKKKQVAMQEHTINYSDIESAIIVINF